ncbi:MAG: HDOD domain-containing protein [Proteobacteria bacterium]|nr:HDOD domain-containing protein [Pseudomonadota bacterium]MBU1738487.1 HDOD domain-containing protein [Pseudomonadota bacterium]
MELKELIKKSRDLPSLPTIAVQINAEIAKESLTAKSIAAIISRDLSLVAKILKMANSAFYGLSSQVDTIERAVMVLGMTSVKSLAMTLSVSSFFREEASGTIDMEGLWHHSLGCAITAKSLVKHDKNLAENAFICGILHDIGKIVIANLMPEEMMMIMGTVAENHIRQSDAEREVLGFDHAQVGAELARSWHFPREYIDAIAHHHQPSFAGDETPGGRIMGAALVMANRISKVKALGMSTDPEKDLVPQERMQALKINDAELVAQVDLAIAEFAKLLEAWGQ